MFAMKVIRTANELTKVLSIHNNIGFVPTMGCLHEGHLCLVKKSKLTNEITVCSIFVNPAQFNDPKDYKLYPVTIDEDITKLESLHCDILFLPGVEEVYPADYQNKYYQIGEIENLWEGFYRPGHFQGVCKVMDRLLDIVPATDLWMGQKDFQQCMVIEKLLVLTNRKNITLHRIETIRSNSGLALSSRNQRLSDDGIIKAATLYESLQLVQKLYQKEDFTKLEQYAKEDLLQNGFEEIEYISVIQKEPSVVIAAAAWIEGVRLIDNIILN